MSDIVASDEVQAAGEMVRRIAANVERAAEVRREVLEHMLVAVLAGGHVLIEDLPGVGKTTLARALARSMDLQFARIQCTADLLPADVVGTNVFNQREDRFEFRPGPIFANVVLVDEINRASPKTQSGLLECMQERRVTDTLRAYVVALLQHTRDDPRVELGGSPRAGLMLLRAAKAHALLAGRDHALPDDVQALAQMVLAHRIVLAPEATEETGERVVADALAATPAL